VIAEAFPKKPSIQMITSHRFFCLWGRKEATKPKRKYKITTSQLTNPANRRGKAKKGVAGEVNKIRIGTQ